MLGTILSNIAVSWWFDAYLVYKYAFQKKPWEFYKDFWLRFMFTMFFGVFLRILCEKLPIEGWLLVIVDAILVTILFNLLFYIIFHKKEEYKYIKNSILHLIKR